MRALLTGWQALFPKLRGIQEGIPWREVLGASDPPAFTPLKSGSISELFPQQELDLELLAGRQLGLVFGGQRLRLFLHQERLDVIFQVRPYKTSPQELEALAKGAPAPRLDALFQELNRRNHDRLGTLFWDPKEGVLGQASLAEGSRLPRLRLEQFLEHLVSEQEEAALSLSSP